jgi:hemoglobin/transferrin/lactoferrin receptor protein
MKRTLIMFLLGGIATNAFSQVLTIRDQVTREPVESVSLLSDRPKANATTNARGQADIGSFQGAEKIAISRFGFKTAVTSFAELESLGFEWLIQPSPLGEHEVVVSATRWRQSAGDVPMKVASVTSEEAAL